jgi:hypothetical protein
MPRPPSARKMENELQEKIIGELLEVLTRPNSAITSRDIGHYRLLAQVMKSSEAIDAHLFQFKYKPKQLTRGILVGILIDVLNRLLKGPEESPAETPQA